MTKSQDLKSQMMKNDVQYYLHDFYDYYFRLYGVNTCTLDLANSNKHHYL